MRRLKLQSAMEYLMTYGWAILVIAVVMVALFSLGILGGGATFGTTCVAQSGYVCSGPIFSASSGTYSATVGQASGTNWGTTLVTFVPAGTPTTSPNSLFNAGNSVSISSLATEQQVPVSIPVNVVCQNAASGVCTRATSNTVPVYAVGTTVTGTMWAQYNVGGTLYYAQLATVTGKSA